MKKIVVAPDSFKGTMSSIEVCDIIKRAIKSVNNNIEVVTVPIADGGEGTVDAFLSAVGGQKVHVKVKDPLMRDVDAYYGLLINGETAVIEMAQASGLGYVEQDRRPLDATSYGTGQLIRDALDKGCSKIVLGLGGSATTDGGIGAAAALGVKFLSKQNEIIPLNGGGLAQLDNIDVTELDKRLATVKILIACDVDNPLFGDQGSAKVFAPQKGATPEEVDILDKNLKHYASVLKERLGVDVSNIKGGGAAGGLGVSLIATSDSEIMSGIQVVLDTVNFQNIIKDAELIITGEGKIDGQTKHGKVPVGIARAAKSYGVPVVAVGGCFGDDYKGIHEEGVHCVFSTINNSYPFEIVKKTCRSDLFDLVSNLIRFLECTQYKSS